MDKNIIKNLDNAELRIAEAAKSAGRNPSEIEIVAASKTRSLETLKLFAADGRIKTFGENRVQEFNSKYTPELNWDIIGQLQTNKVKYVIGKVRLIHSVDREPLAEEINRLAAKRDLMQDVLIEINTGAEEAKGGILFDEVEAFALLLQKYPNIKLRGVTAVAPKEIERDALRTLFLKVRTIYEKLKAEYPQDITTLSMGMSNDFDLAVECGSNLVRLGRVLFD